MALEIRELISVPLAWNQVLCCQFEALQVEPLDGDKDVKKYSFWVLQAQAETPSSTNPTVFKFQFHVCLFVSPTNSRGSVHFNNSFGIFSVPNLNYKTFASCTLWYILLPINPYTDNYCTYWAGRLAHGTHLINHKDPLQPPAHTLIWIEPSGLFHPTHSNQWNRTVWSLCHAPGSWKKKGRIEKLSRQEK